MTCVRPLLLTVMLFTLSLASAVLAQIDPRAEALLNSVADSFGSEAQPDTFETLDMTVCVTSYETGEKQSDTCIRTVMDVLNRRMYGETRSEAEGESFEITMAYQNGRAVIIDSFSAGLPEEDAAFFELPEADVAAIEANFEAVFDQISEVADAIPEEYERATYDGEVSYGGVLSGEQVTATTLLPVFVPGGPSSQEVIMRLVFGPQGQLIGNVFDTPDVGAQTGGSAESTVEEVLLVYTDPTDKTPFTRYANVASYRLEGDTATLLSENRVTHFVLNEPLDEALFRLE